jgi:hypothetical protein
MEHILDTLTFAAEVGDFVVIKTWDGLTVAGYVAHSAVDNETFTVGMPGRRNAIRLHVADIEEVVFE